VLAYPPGSSPADHGEGRLLVGGMCRLRERLAGSVLRRERRV